MSPWSPQPSECIDLLRDAGAPEWVVEHCQCVAHQAAALARVASQRGHGVDEALVVKGALLHDLGRSVTQGLDHAYRGADLLREAGVDEQICRIAEVHTGGGITVQEAAAAGLPDRDYLPATLEEKLVCHADNCYSGTSRWTLERLRAKYHGRGLEDAFGRIEGLHGELEALLGVDPFSVPPLDGEVGTA